MRLFSSFLNQFLKNRATWNVCISVNIAWECKSCISKFKLAIIEWNQSWFSLIAFLVFKLYWITQGYFLFAPPGIYIQMVMPVKYEAPVTLHTITIPRKSFAYLIHVSGHTGTICSSVTANMNLIGERFFWYRYRIVIVCNVTGAYWYHWTNYWDCLLYNRARKPEEGGLPTVDTRGCQCVWD